MITLNAVQVLVAPIPGYVPQIVAGYLFGWFRGGIFSAIGMALGGILAMVLVRIYGRPLVQRVAGANRMERWEEVAHLNSIGIWFLIMLGPFGDIPYFIAGLTRLPIWKIVFVAVLVRGPSVVIAAAVGDGVISWRSPWVIGGAIVLMLTGLIGVRYQERIERWIDENLLNRSLTTRMKRPQRTADQPAAKAGSEPAPHPDD